MSCRVLHLALASGQLPGWSRRVACLLLLTVLAACGSHPSHHARHYSPSRYYQPPGPRSDPWGPYIHEASGRFGVPEPWVRRVMRQESGGQEDVISWAGAMGLMQLMPDTYDDLKGRYNFGDDPFDPHNNILAGTAYLREMYDRFGAPGFLAAYNAGPNRLDRYLSNGIALPEETVNYVASIAPLLGPGTPMSGPLAVYAGQSTRLAARSTPAGCDPDAAYNPDGPCTPLAPASIQPVVATSYDVVGCDPDAAYDPTRPCRKPPSTGVPATFVTAAPNAPADCDPDAAYDPTRPCQPMPAIAMAPVIAQPLPPPPSRAPSQPDGRSRPLQEKTGSPAERVAFAAAPSAGRWAIQVGAFANLRAAQAAAEQARMMAPDLLRMAKIELPPTAPLGNRVAFRARLSGVSQLAAQDACARLGSQAMPCLTVPPRDAF